MLALTIGTSGINTEDGLYSLSDLHKASGGEKKHEPYQFIRNDQTQALIEELSSANSRDIPVKTIRGRGKAQGTYVCKELVIAYAAWISPAFHLRVLRTFLAQQEQPNTFLSTRRWLVSFLDGREVIQEIDRDDFILKYEDLPKLLSEPDCTASPTLLADIARACLSRLENSVSRLKAT